jgi:DNA-binding NarL/FixJ family response regulator
MDDEDYILEAMIQAGAETNINKAVSSAELLKAIYATQSKKPNYLK